MKADRVKANGVHYTPRELAKFLAEVVAERLSDGTNPLEILDPACGDGALLFAFSQVVPSRLRERVTLCGYETDGGALRQAASCLQAPGWPRLFSNRRTFWQLQGIDAARGKGKCRCSMMSESAP